MRNLLELLKRSNQTGFVTYRQGIFTAINNKEKEKR